jgi:hypothetical protein
MLIANGHLMEDCRESKKPCPKCLEHHLTADILSRIIEAGVVMKFTGADYRHKLGGEFRARRKSERTTENI